MCQFVTIIIHIFVGIRVFFFVFAGGILAFAIAILHLVRACPFGTCDYSKVNFPHHLFRAVSSTYFFMVRPHGRLITYFLAEALLLTTETSSTLHHITRAVSGVQLKRNLVMTVGMFTS